MIDETTVKTKIIDFGSIIDKKKLSYKNFYISTRYYRAPEIIYNLMFNEKIDIWSIGCIIAELVRNKPLLTAKVTLFTDSKQSLTGLFFLESSFSSSEPAKTFDEKAKVNRIMVKIFFII